MLTVVTLARQLEQEEQEAARNVNNLKRPLLHGDIYRVWGEPQERPHSPSSLRVTLARAEEWVKNSVGWREKVVVELAWRQLITLMAFADAQTSRLTK